MSSLLLDVTIKGTLALLATGAVVALLRSAPAATRHAVWTMGMAGALVLPVLSRILPGWNVPLLPAGTGTPGSAAAAVGSGPELGSLLALAWAIGAGVVLASIALGRIRIWWIGRGAATLDHGEIPALTTALCGDMRISRRVSVRLCPDRVMPMVWGVARPVVLLPAEAARWPLELKRVVLLHELAHVRRHDSLNQLVVRLACAVYWFHPLAWVAARRLRAERERACDDHVLGTGASACDYAEQLLAVARRLRPRARGTLAMAMAGRSAFGERVAALLDARRARGVMTAGLLLRSGLGAACLVVPLAALDPGVRPGAIGEPSPPQIVGPPPSANAKAAGAIPADPPPRPESDTAVQPGRPPRTPRPAERASMESARERVVVLAELVVVPGHSREGESTECEQSSTPAVPSASKKAAPGLVWIPTGGATP